jgi:hypothetical protein
MLDALKLRVAAGNAAFRNASFLARDDATAIHF